MPHTLKKLETVCEENAAGKHKNWMTEVIAAAIGEHCRSKEL